MKIDNKLRDFCHSLAKDNGWWETPNPKPRIWALIRSEADEAFEGLRSNKRATVTPHMLNELSSVWEPNGGLVMIDPQDWAAYFKKHIKDSIEDEVADIVIRCMDFAGAYDYPVVTYIERPEQYAKVTQMYKLMQSDNHTMQSIPLEEFILYAIMHQSDPLHNVRDSEFEDVKTIGNIIEACMAISAILEFDLIQHIMAKLAYNTTRPAKHGKEF